MRNTLECDPKSDPLGLALGSWSLTVLNGCLGLLAVACMGAWVLLGSGPPWVRLGSVRLGSALGPPRPSGPPWVGPTW
eukprot:8924583-Pyramimonas_sp.AAC.2